MICRECGKEIEDDVKIFKKNAFSLQLKADGFFCACCNKFIGVFEER